MTRIWEVFALKYAERNKRTRADSFINDPHHDAPHPMDYFVWLLRSGEQAILVDTGYEETEADRRERPIIVRPSTLLRQLDVKAAELQSVIVTHLHYDHAGTLGDYPNAAFHLQAAEMAYATGPCMCHQHLRMPFTGKHVCEMIDALYCDRVVFAEGKRTIADGIEVHLIGGHSRGLQCVRVHTRRGWVVLASDASHYYENYRSGKPFPIVVDVDRMLEGFAHLKRLADSDAHVIPGHDPLVRELYPAVDPAGQIVALHGDPKGGTG